MFGNIYKLKMYSGNNLLSSGLVCPQGRLIGVPDTTMDDALP